MQFVQERASFAHKPNQVEGHLFSSAGAELYSWPARGIKTIQASKVESFLMEFEKVRILICIVHNLYLKVVQRSDFFEIIEYCLFILLMGSNIYRFVLI